MFSKTSQVFHLMEDEESRRNVILIILFHYMLKEFGKD